MRELGIAAIEMALESGTAEVLTLEKAKALKGKRIATKYHGYKGQHGHLDFIVGDIKSQLDIAREEPMKDSVHDNRAAYWESYMTERKLEEVATNLVLLTQEGKTTHMVCHTVYANYYAEPTFTCSDADREVYFVVLEKVGVSSPMVYIVDFLEVVVDITKYREFWEYSKEDSREDVSDIIEWSKEFQTLHEKTDWAEVDYTETLERFAENKRLNS